MTTPTRVIHHPPARPIDELAADLMRHYREHKRIARAIDADLANATTCAHCGGPCHDATDDNGQPLAVCRRCGVEVWL